MLKSKLEVQYASKKENQQREIDDLRAELERKSKDHAKLSSAMNDLKAANDQLQVNKYAVLLYVQCTPLMLFIIHRSSFLNNHLKSQPIFLKRKEIWNV